eukprot:TRINITY_DN1169_c0_g1_i3.p2 TRINITY_DN1169_c0_g1~~TRINITY_DN1169_c0_g1_i3.p2  ORF type:complete len:373 (+),score=113.57 TRINITY_DN1169_c0_g1_i3:93-1211(+)
MGVAKYAVPGLVAAVALWFASGGNPTQRIDKLFAMMSRGMAGGESATAFEGLYQGVTGNEQHSHSDAGVANSFYNLATEFYEYGWGDSFHFGFRQAHEPHSMCIHNSQAHVAQKLAVGDMDKVLDLGCGIGGPLRGIVRMTGANITGLTINAFQVQRAREITAGLTPYMQARCHYDVQDYLDIRGYPENTYDGAFYMESSLHCENRTKTFAEAFRLLKPGGRLVAMEYVTLPAWDAKNPEHHELMTKHTAGNGAARTPTIEEDLAMIRAAGFEIREHYDFMGVGDRLYGDKVWPWWQDLQFNWRFHLLPAHPWVRGPLPTILRWLSYIGLVPSEVAATADLMNVGGDGLSGLGKLGAITPQYYVLGIKPGGK